MHFPPSANGAQDPLCEGQGMNHLGKSFFSLHFKFDNDCIHTALTNARHFIRALDALWYALWYASSIVKFTASVIKGHHGNPGARRV